MKITTKLPLTNGGDDNSWLLHLSVLLTAIDILNPAVNFTSSN
jgi:hypothetical protein